ncbi:MAG: NUDIX domain-containing protein [Candidatus Pacearchaeota archaeon]
MAFSPITPKLTVDGVLIRQNKILLIQRKNEPIGWALPGGLVDIGETVEQAVSREIHEETGLDIPSKLFQLVGVYSDPTRDPRGHNVSLAYYCFMFWNDTTSAGSDAKQAVWFDLQQLPMDIVFDHKQIIHDTIVKFNHTFK